MGMPLSDGIINSVSLVIVVVILSYLSLVLGELVPKRLAMQKSQEVAMFAVKPLNVISAITSPFIKLLTVSTNIILRFFGVAPNENVEKITEEEIRFMVDVGEEKGIIRETEKEMIDNIFEFDNTQVFKIMTHRTNIIGIPIDSTLEEVTKIVVEEQFSRIPVYDESIDNIVGILHTKDLLRLVGPGLPEQFSLADLLRKPIFVPRFKKTDELFKELQSSKNHIAIVIDEYGGTAGLVTIEDLIEEIMGNIFDEYDEEEKEIEKIDENTFMVDGACDLETIQEHFDMEMPIDSYETLSGFIIGQIGRILEDDEKPVVEYGSLVFKVEHVEEKRITKVKVCKAS
jgi:putative hemolysin